ncbi:hypothetical protein IU449_14175 [Nocardia higoensis]|uniref:Uncharacterized protein n=1 Tax=Nocardia higoensis TaxID=228599 RepID=A0ABS0DG62_9NOCA|nr:hypothetical protein [Nocardia higoensis]MBF6355678.1 hypothetical protein [Nocardia higoensis]
MTSPKPAAVQSDPAEQSPEKAGGRKKRVNLYDLSPNQLALFEQEDTEQ